MRRVTLILAWLLVLPALPSPAATVVFDLRDLTTQPVANRKVLISPSWLNPANAIGALDQQMFRSDASGSFTVSNMAPGIYDCEIQRPPARTPFTIYVPDTNVTLQANALRIVSTNATESPNAYAWSAAASDARYAAIGSIGEGSGQTNLTFPGDYIKTTSTNGGKDTIVSLDAAALATNSPVSAAISNAPFYPSGSNPANYVAAASTLSSDQPLLGNSSTAIKPVSVATYLTTLGLYSADQIDAQMNGKVDTTGDISDTVGVNADTTAAINAAPFAPRFTIVLTNRDPALGPITNSSMSLIFWPTNMANYLTNNHPGPYFGGLDIGNDMTIGGSLDVGNTLTANLFSGNGSGLTGIPISGVTGQAATNSAFSAAIAGKAGTNELVNTSNAVVNAIGAKANTNSPTLWNPTIYGTITDTNTLIVSGAGAINFGAYVGYDPNGTYTWDAEQNGWYKNPGTTFLIHQVSPGDWTLTDVDASWVYFESVTSVTNGWYVVDSADEPPPTVRYSSSTSTANYLSLLGVYSKSAVDALLAGKQDTNAVIDQLLLHNLSGFTNLNASALSTGTIPDARFPGTLPALNGSLLTSLDGTHIQAGTISSNLFDSVTFDWLSGLGGGGGGGSGNASTNAADQAWASTSTNTFNGPVNLLGPTTMSDVLVSNLHSPYFEATNTTFINPQTNSYATPSTLLGSDADKVQTSIAVGSGLSLSGGTLSATGTATYTTTNFWLTTPATNINAALASRFDFIISTNCTVTWSNASAGKHWEATASQDTNGTHTLTFAALNGKMLTNWSGLLPTNASATMKLTFDDFHTQASTNIMASVLTNFLPTIALTNSLAGGGGGSCTVNSGDIVNESFEGSVSAGWTQVSTGSWGDALPGTSPCDGLGTKALGATTTGTGLAGYYYDTGVSSTGTNYWRFYLYVDSSSQAFSDKNKIFAVTEGTDLTTPQEIVQFINQGDWQLCLSSPSSGTINVALATWYRVELRTIRNGDCVLHVYDASGTELSGSPITESVAGGNNAQYVHLGVLAKDNAQDCNIHFDGFGGSTSGFLGQ